MVRDLPGQKFLVFWSCLTLESVLGWSILAAAPFLQDEPDPVKVDVEDAQPLQLFEFVIEALHKHKIQQGHTVYQEGKPLLR